MDRIAPDWSLRIAAYHGERKCSSRLCLLLTRRRTVKYYKVSQICFSFCIGIIDNTTKLETGTDKNSLQNDKGIAVSTVNFCANMTAAKAKEMILKKLIRKAKDTLGTPMNSKVNTSLTC